MATTFKWTTATDRSGSTGGGLTTELNALANGGFAAPSSGYDNTSNLDEWAEVHVHLATLNPTTGAYLQLFLQESIDGTTFEDAPSATNPGYGMSVATESVATGSGTKEIKLGPFRLPPGKFKMNLKNATNVALGASGNTAKLFTFNEQGV